MSKAPVKIINAAAFDNLSAVVFDVGDTLFDTTSLMRSALKYAAFRLQERGFVSDVEHFYNTYLEVDRLTLGPSVNHLFSGIGILTEVWRSLGIALSPAPLGTFLGSYRDYVRQGIPHDSRMVALFRDLRRAGYKLGILTDGSTEEQLDQLFRLGIIEFVDVVVTSEQVGEEKPGRRLFESVLANLAVHADQTVMVGNDPMRDIDGACAAGMHTIWVVSSSMESAIPPESTDGIANSTLAIKNLLLGARHGT